MSDERPILSETMFVGERVILYYKDRVLEGTIGEFGHELTIKTDVGERYKRVFLDMGFTIRTADR